MSTYTHIPTRDQSYIPPPILTSDEKTALIQSQLNDITDTIKTNIDKVIERGEKIEVIVEKSDQLDEHAIHFRKQAKNMRWKMQCRSYRNYALLVFILLSLLILILWVAGAFK